MQLDFLNTTWNILAIDDSKLNRAIIKKTLEGLNMVVDEAKDGLDGLECMKKKKYDLVLVDIVMPNLDGFGFLEKFGQLIGNNFIPVILMTGSDDLNSKIKGLRIGADDFLVKPLNDKELVARVFSLLRLKNAHMQLYEKNMQIQRELETAKKVQQFIIPKNFSAISYPRISARYLPIEDIGGDFFDFYQLKNDRYGFLIADVTGHGIPAALVMTMAKMLFSIYAPMFTATMDLFTIVNDEIKSLLLSHQYITGFYAIYEPQQSRILYTNAGHTRALYYKQASDQVVGLDTKGLFIGITDDGAYEMKAHRVEKGDRLLLYTDGITELMNGEREDYGEKRLAHFMRENRELAGDRFCDALLGDLTSFRPLEERKDDIAFMNIEF